MLCRICSRAQIQPKEHVLDHAGYTTPTRQHELDHADQESIFPERSRSLGKMDDLSEVLTVTMTVAMMMNDEQQRQRRRKYHADIIYIYILYILHGTIAFTAYRGPLVHTGETTRLQHTLTPKRWLSRGWRRQSSKFQRNSCCSTSPSAGCCLPRAAATVLVPGRCP